MRRDHVVSIRLTDAEHAALAKLGRPTDVLRKAIRDATNPPALPPPLGWPSSAPTTTVGYIPPKVVWMDGTANGGSWPELVTC